MKSSSYPFLQESFDKLALKIFKKKEKSCFVFVLMGGEKENKKNIVDNSIVYVFSSLFISLWFAVYLERFLFRSTVGAMKTQVFSAFASSM